MIVAGYYGFPWWNRLRFAFIYVYVISKGNLYRFILDLYLNTVIDKPKQLNKVSVVHFTSNK